MSRTRSLMEEIEHMFTEHDIDTKQAETMGHIRNKGKALAFFLADNVPDCPELHEAIKFIDHAVKSANSGIARN